MILFTVMMMFVTSCGGSSEAPGAGSAYIGGIEGVSLKFIEAAPPAEVIAPESAVEPAAPEAAAAAPAGTETAETESHP